ncbi:hypothetical protein MtrunA17_Chr7g0228771 [Medicago truncatula]|uniref:Transmembrane protein n=1 Tax=Medicago truncatula TaxID=3880 RepID=A0A396H0R5_MEDTR|nr:hypothetical protein MtrunA17_Chr7g0228771 [Medicago truncatula]
MDLKVRADLVRILAALWLCVCSVVLHVFCCAMCLLLAVSVARLRVCVCCCRAGLCFSVVLRFFFVMQVMYL